MSQGPGGPGRPAVDELPRRQHVRKVSDVLRLVVASAVAVPGLLLPTLGSEAMAGAQADAVRAFGRLPAGLRSATIGIAQLVAVAAPAVVAAALAARRRTRRCCWRCSPRCSRWLVLLPGWLALRHLRRHEGV